MSDLSTVGQELKLTADQVSLIKRTVAKGATNDELAMFMHVARKAGLDPFMRQVHFVKRGTSATIQTGIDGYRVLAARTGAHAGTDDAIFEEDNDNLISATVTVYRIVQNVKCAYTATARWDEYKPDSDFMWKKMPHTMLAKCAEALALRKGFSEVLSGLYTHEEMAQAGNEAIKMELKDEIKIPAKAIAVTLAKDKLTLAKEQNDSVVTKGNGSKIADKLNKIKDLMKESGIDPTDDTADAWNLAIKKQFNLSLEPANYDEIIKALDITPPEYE